MVRQRLGAVVTICDHVREKRETVVAQRSGVEGVELFEADVRLAGYVQAGEIPTIAGVQHMDGRTSWDRWLDGLSEHRWESSSAHHGQSEPLGHRHLGRA